MAEAVTVLACGNCRSPLFGLSTDSAFLCSECGSGWGIGTGGLTRLPVSVRATSGDGSIPLPFWLVEAMVKVESRITRRGVHHVPVQRGRVFSPRSEPGLRETGGASGVRRLVIPAFALNGVFELGVKLSALQETFPGETAGGWPRLAGVFSDPGEAAELARGVATGQEASSEDWLADLKLSVDVGSTTLLVLPAVVKDEMVQLPWSGLSFFKRNMPDLERILAFHEGSPR